MSSTPSTDRLAAAGEDLNEFAERAGIPALDFSYFVELTDNLNRLLDDPESFIQSHILAVREMSEVSRTNAAENVLAGDLDLLEIFLREYGSKLDSYKIAQVSKLYQRLLDILKDHHIRLEDNQLRLFRLGYMELARLRAGLEVDEVFAGIP